MVNRAFIGEVYPYTDFIGEFTFIAGPVFVMSPEGEAVVNVYDMQYSYVAYIDANYTYDYASVRAAIEQNIKDQWNDQTIEMVWINDAGITLDPTISAPSRSLNSSFRPSLTRLSWVSYTVELSVTAGLLNGATATVELRSDSSSTPTTVIASAKDSCGALLGLSSTLRFQLSGWVKKGDYVKLISSTTGSASATLISSHETVF